MISYEEALKKVLNEVPAFSIEKIALENSYGRYLAQSIKADRDYPPFNRSMMDGFAIDLNNIKKEEKESFTIKEIIKAGSSATHSLKKGDAYKIMTGAVVPNSANCVIPVEKCIIKNDVVIIDTRELINFKNIAKQGEDLKQGDSISLKENKISMTEMSLLANLGFLNIDVIKNPTISLLNSGDEINSSGEDIEQREIRNSNYFSVLGALQSLNLDLNYLGVAKDNKEDLKQKISIGLKSDVFITTGGVSMGDTDYIPKVLEELGVEKIFHKVGIKPGKPIWFGKKGKTIVFGLPGNPLSVMVNFRVFVYSFLKAYFENRNEFFSYQKLENPPIKAHPLDRFLPTTLENGIYTIQTHNGSGDVMAGLGTVGLAHIPKNKIIRTIDTVKILYWL